MSSDIQTFEYQLDTVFFSNIGADEIQKGKLTVNLTVKKIQMMYELNFQINGTIVIPCDRCLDEMDFAVDTNDRLIVKFGNEYAEESDEIIVIPEYEGEINVAYTTRKRHITRTLITEEWKGAVNKIVRYKNPFGFMPVPLGHNCYEGEWRGNSVFGRVLRWLKASHDVAYKRDEILSEFEPKIIQMVRDPQTWIKNNTKEVGSSETQFDPFGRKLFINQEGESTNFLFLPGDATAQHTAALQDNERKIIKGSGIPELFFGALATGNYASTETDRLLALEYVKGIRRELTKGTQELMVSEERVKGIADRLLHSPLRAPPHRRRCRCTIPLRRIPYTHRCSAAHRPQGWRDSPSPP